MSDEKIKIKIITHEKVVFEQDVDEIYSMGIDGSFGVLKGHIPFITPLEIGVTKVVKGGVPEFIATMGGVFQFSDNHAVILTDTAEVSGDIDATRAHAAKERAEARINAKSTDVQIERAEIALAKAIARINAAEKRF